MTMLRNNQRVRISGEAGTVVGRIEDIRTIAEMPAASAVGVPLSEYGEPGDMLREMGVEHVAVITYHTTPNAELMFTAIEIGGEWYDLKRQKLEIEVIGAYTN
jgi:hypothetical protein